ncbi:MAG: HIT family protein [Burkholderiaceae bacterium]|nr:HIT family protein [Burkholderiaceae bacterium]
MPSNCPLCTDAGGVLIASSPLWRVIRAEDAAFPAFYRVVWNEHVAEFSALPAAHRNVCMDVVCTVEQVLIHALQPTKINLAALGNVVPHLHWHVIARFDADSHFPQPVWGAPQREQADASSLLKIGLVELDARMGATLQHVFQCA